VTWRREPAGQPVEKRRFTEEQSSATGWAINHKLVVRV
jgi:hypothetical protein